VHDPRPVQAEPLLPARSHTGITFDATGHFGHKLLVTASNHAETAVLAIGCAGGVRATTSPAPAMEGGIAVAPESFGRYRGDLVAPGETSERVFAIRPDASVVTLVASGLTHGSDIASKAPASCRPDPAPAAPSISPTGFPRATGTRARTASCACRAGS
jgi:hypothetical protein